MNQSLPSRGLSRRAFYHIVGAETPRPRIAPQYEELPNFHQVNGHLYRGAQPRPDGFRRLAALGVKTVVNLRGADDNSRAEESEARAAGLEYFNVPLPPYARPSDEQVE